MKLDSLIALIASMAIAPVCVSAEARLPAPAESLVSMAPAAALELPGKPYLAFVEPTDDDAHQAHDHAHAHEHAGLHFSHPLITESPSPDTKVRIDYFWMNQSGGDTHTLRLEGEIAFARWISVEVDVPYTFVDMNGSRSNLDNVEVALKLACFCFEQYGLLLGGGIELGLPTGDDNKGIGSNNEIEIEPYIDGGLRIGQVELVAFLSFGIPVNETADEADEVDLALGYNFSVLVHVTPQVMAILEFDGEAVVLGDSDEATLYITPGIKFRPCPNLDLEIGAGVSFPLTDDKEFHVRTVLSVFLHF